MTFRIKLCGVRTAKDALVCAEAGADEIGVVFARSSKRCVSIASAQMIRDALPAHIPLIGVFLDASTAEVEAVLSEVKLAAVQLHGALPERKPKLPIHVALQVADRGSLERIAQLPWAARLLLDSPKGGGSGASFDWDLVPHARALSPIELFLAGGLTVDNVAEAIRRARPDGVDVASGIEDAAAFKDPARVRAFVQAARAAAVQVESQ